MPLFNSISLYSRSAETSEATAILSGVGVNIALDAIAVMLDRWRWESMTDASWDTLEADLSEALENIMENGLVGTVVWRRQRVA